MAARVVFTKRPEVVTSKGGLTTKVVFAKRPRGGQKDKEAQGRRFGEQGGPNKGKVETKRRY